MKCAQIQSKLIFLIDGDLDSNDSVNINEHIENCHECNYLFNQLKASLVFLENDKQTETNPFFYTRVMAGLAKQPKQSPMFGWLREKQYWLQVSAYCLMVAGAIYFGNYLGKDKIAIEIESVSQANEISDNQLFADSYLLQLHEEDIYTINANENGE